MTRSWTFALASSAVWYNLWSDLIAQDATFTDPTFTSASFIPSMVSELLIQGSDIVFVSEDSRKLGGVSAPATPGSYRKSMITNSICLKDIYLKPNSAAVSCEIAITSI